MTTAAPRRTQRSTSARGTPGSGTRTTLRDLTGRAYENAEREAWDSLQAELADIAALTADEPF